MVHEGSPFLALTQISPEVMEKSGLHTGDSLRPQKQDGSPDCLQRQDGYNCGVFMATSAMCLAFGYDLCCYA